MPSHPTLINLPPPPSDPVTPSDIPGTPNSATTSMSELSTVAIKDGHRGHLAHARQNAPQPDAERADRISRLAGLERVTTARQPTPNNNLTPGAAAPPHSGAGYFDPHGNPVMGKERSTVGSASATGSVGGRTTWASGSQEGDKMSDGAGDDGDEMELDRGSVGGLSDDATGSLVGFGEGARTPARQSYGSPMAKSGMRGESVTPTVTSAASVAQELRDARMIDGFTRDGDGGMGRQAAERIMRERIGDEGGTEPDRRGGLGTFEFEGK